MAFLQSALWLALAAISLNGFTQSSAQADASPDPVLTIKPACPISHTEAFTKELRIDYFPSRKGATIQDPKSLTLRLTFDSPNSFHNGRTIAFQPEEDGTWRAVVPLTQLSEYAIWYVSDQTGKRDDNDGRYWDTVFCDASGKKLSDGVRDQAMADAGAILDRNMKRMPDYGRAINDIEQSGVRVKGVLLYDEWVYKLRLQGQQKHAEQKLITEIEEGIARQSDNPDYLRWTADFLVVWQTAFPSSLVRRAVELADQHPESGMPSMQSEFERETAEGIEDRSARAKALGEWLAKYPNERFYANGIRTERLELFDRVGDIASAENVFLDLKFRFPDEAALNVSMAAIYIRHKVKLNEAQRLLDKAEKQRQSHSTLFLPLAIFNGDPNQDKATLNYWTARVLLQEQRWSKGEQLLQGAARILDEAEPYAVLAEAQQRNHELKKARNSYLDASLRSSERQQQYVEEFVRLSLKTGTSNREAAMREMAEAKKRIFDREHYKPAVVDLPTPNFRFQDMNGEIVTPLSLRGQTVLLDLWSSWCEPCVSELAGFEQIRQAHPEVRVLLVATRSELSQVRKIVAEQGIRRSEILLDDSDSSGFGLSGVPQTYVIDGNGRTRIVHYGSVPDVKSYVEADLASLKSAQLN